MPRYSTAFERSKRDAEGAGRRAFLRYRPAFAKQAALHISPKKIRICVTGARAGKTECGIADAILRAVEQPGYKRRSVIKGEPYTIGIVAPSYPMLERVILPKFLRLVPREIIRTPYHHTNRMIRLYGTKGITEVWFVTGQRAEGLQGVDWNGAYADEFPLLNESVWDELRTRISNQRGWLLATGTPRGANWVKTRIFDPWRAGLDSDLAFFTWFTADNPYFPREELEYARRTMPPAYFRRTFEASWESFEGQVFETYLDETHRLPASRYQFQLGYGMAKRIVERRPGALVIPLVEVVAGVDWGFSTRGAIIVLGRSTSGFWFALDESYGTKVPVTAASEAFDSWVRRARALRAKWGISRFWADTSNPEAISKFNSAGITTLPSNKDRLQGMQSLLGLFTVPDEPDSLPKFFIMSNCEEFRDEVLHLHWLEGKDDWEKIRDHGVDAARYAIHNELLSSRFDREVKRIRRPRHARKRA